MKKVSDREWQTILEQSPTNDELLWIIKYTNKKDEARKMLERNKKMIEIIKER